MKYIRIKKDCQCFVEGLLLTLKEVEKIKQLKTWENIHEYNDIVSFGEEIEAKKNEITFFLGGRFEISFIDRKFSLN